METATYSSEVEAGAPVDTSGIGGHPGGLTTLFFTEMWERFSYYGMRAILVLFMVAPVAQGGLQFDNVKAGTIYGTYTASAYLTSLIGGWLADRFLGARLAVLIGGIIIASGHFSMAYPSLHSFYAGLVLIAAGTGLLKPNVTTMVGSLYSPTDPRRDAGFSVFYMGINVGALVAPLVCGTLAQSEGFKSVLSGMGWRAQDSWHWGFAAAGVGMVFGLAQYLFHRSRLEQVGNKPGRRPSLKPGTGSGTVSEARQRLTPEEVKRIAVIVILFFFSAIFWMAFEQAGSSLNLFADQLTRNRIFGYDFPSSWYQSINSIFLIILAPVFSVLWLRLGDRQPSSPVKFSVGLIFAGLGFVVVAYAASLTGRGPVGPMWLVVVYLLHTIGELCLSPVGLSTVTKLAPARLVGSMMGVWFLSLAVGNYAAGRLAGFFTANAEGALVRLFGYVALTTIGSGLLLAAMSPFIRKLMGKVR
ncbi:MAG TPA: peptide MFS transporter [Acidobacteriota bacterium]|jgi:POT family proton-dependent oligopeptide transporter